MYSILKHWRIIEWFSHFTSFWCIHKIQSNRSKFYSSVKHILVKSGFRSHRKTHPQTNKEKKISRDETLFLFLFLFLFFPFSTFCLFISVDWIENAPATSFCWKRKISFSCEFFVGSVLSKQNKTKQEEWQKNVCMWIYEIILK